MGFWTKAGEVLKVAGKGAGELAKKAGEKSTIVAELGKDWISERSGVAGDIIEKFNEWRTARKAEKEKNRLEEKEYDYSEVMKKTDGIEEALKELGTDLSRLKSSVEDISEESENFKLIVSNEIKNLYDEVNGIYDRINSEKAAQKKRFAVQTVILAIGVVAAIVLGVVAIIL